MEVLTLARTLNNKNKLKQTKTNKQNKNKSPQNLKQQK